MDHGARAHHAWLDRAVHRHTGQAVVSQAPRGFAKSDDFSMGRRILRRYRLIESPPDDSMVGNDDGADRDFTRATRFLRFNKSQNGFPLLGFWLLASNFMKLLSKLALFFFLTPAWLVAQPGVRMSADFLP